MENLNANYLIDNLEQYIRNHGSDEEDISSRKKFKDDGDSQRTKNL